MTAGDIANICGTVAVIQSLADVLSYYLIYQKEDYQRGVDSYRRAAARLQAMESEHDKERAKRVSNSKQRDKLAAQYQKKLERLQDEVGALKTKVVARHSVPNFGVSIVFLLVFRVFATEYTGGNPRVVALLPFQPPFATVTKFLVARGLHFPAADVVDYERVYQHEFSHRVSSIHQG
jgi:hypothetical protein